MDTESMEVVAVGVMDTGQFMDIFLIITFIRQ